MADDTTTLRRCIGSARYGIEPHEAPPDEFPVQPSQKDGLGRMCRAHWNQYTAGLARDAKVRKAAAAETEPEAEGAPPVIPAAEPRRRAHRHAAVPAAGAQGDAG